MADNAEMKNDENQDGDAGAGTSDDRSRPQLPAQSSAWPAFAPFRDEGGSWEPFHIEVKQSHIVAMIGEYVSKPKIYLTVILSLLSRPLALAAGI